MSAFMSFFASLVEHLADLLQPLFHGSAAAAAIVLFTALVRLLVHPLSRAAARGRRARSGRARCTRGPMRSAKATVPMPAVPPSSQPTASTVNSMLARAIQMGTPKRV